MAFLSDNCTFCELTQGLLDVCRPFSCGNDDLDDFFANDAVRYAKFLMGKTYCFRVNSDLSKIASMFTLSNDSIRIYDSPPDYSEVMKVTSYVRREMTGFPGRFAASLVPHVSTTIRHSLSSSGIGASGWNRSCSPLGPSVQGILQARILEWVAISYSRGSS